MGKLKRGAKATQVPLDESGVPALADDVFQPRAAPDDIPGLGRPQLQEVPSRLRADELPPAKLTPERVEKVGIEIRRETNKFLGTETTEKLEKRALLGEMEGRSSPINITDTIEDLDDLIATKVVATAGKLEGKTLRIPKAEIGFSAPEKELFSEIKSLSREAKKFSIALGAPKGQLVLPLGRARSILSTLKTKAAGTSEEITKAINKVIKDLDVIVKESLEELDPVKAQRLLALDRGITSQLTVAETLRDTIKNDPAGFLSKVRRSPSIMGTLDAFDNKAGTNLKALVDDAVREEAKLGAKRTAIVRANEAARASAKRANTKALDEVRALDKKITSLNRQKARAIKEGNERAKAGLSADQKAASKARNEALKRAKEAQKAAQEVENTKFEVQQDTAEMTVRVLLSAAGHVAGGPLGAIGVPNFGALIGGIIPKVAIRKLARVAAPVLSGIGKSGVIAAGSQAERALEVAAGSSLPDQQAEDLINSLNQTPQ